MSGKKEKSFNNLLIFHLWPLLLTYRTDPPISPEDIELKQLKKESEYIIKMMSL